jgi:hypothetical protein
MSADHQTNKDVHAHDARIEAGGHATTSDRTMMTLERVAVLWRELLCHMLTANPVHRISAIDMRKRVRGIVDLLETCGAPGTALIKTPLAGLTPMW